MVVTDSDSEGGDRVIAVKLRLPEEREKMLQLRLSEDGVSEKTSRVKETDAPEMLNTHSLPPSTLSTRFISCPSQAG